MMTRERFQAVMTFQPFDRLPINEWAVWWDKTIERWHDEGLPRSLTDRYELNRYFGHDVYKQDWFRIRGPGLPKPAYHGAPIIESMADYERALPHLYPDPEDVIDRAKWEAWAGEQARGEIAIWFTWDGFFWFPRTLLGIEPHLYAFYDSPDLMHRINTDLCDWMLRTLDALCAICVPDFMTFAEDMSYNNGPMLSEAHFDEFMLPYYEKIVPCLKECGVIPLIDSDGNITVPANWFERAGLRGILPLERQSGVDVAQLRAQHPHMLFIGAFDKMTMTQGEAAMRAEFERLMPVARGGGLIIGCDHQTPPGVSLEEYWLYMRLFREYAESV
jgi:hypothetical protein